MKNLIPVWEKARGHYHYPSLKEPKVVDKLDGGACYDFKKRETLVDKNFVDETSRKGGITSDQCLEGILIHEIGHYMTFPRTLGTLILAAKMIDDFFDKQDQETRGFVLQTYADMADDLDSVLKEQRTNQILDIRKACQAGLEGDELNTNVRAVMLAYLHHQAQREYKLKPELKENFERMKEIDFLNENVEAMRLGIWTFGNIIVDMLKKYGGAKGSCNGFGPSDMELKGILQNASPEDMKEALREISGKITKREFDKLKEWLKENGTKLPQLPQAITIGTSGGELPVDQDVLDYYKQLSMNYPLVISKKLLETESTIRTWSDTEKWRPCKDPGLALPGSSGGKILPGITRSIRIEHRPIKSTDYKVPHLLVVIDSSGSMPVPDQRKSYAVLGAYCAARSYHLHGSSVGVINFSSQSFYLPYTRELDHSLGAISAFQGGGTVVDIEMVRKMLGPEMAELYAKNPEYSMRRLPREAIKKELSIGVPDDVFKAESIDVLMFTDGGIYNLGEVLSLFEERAELNRATVVLTHGFEQEIKEFSEKINVHEIEDEKDIPNIIIEQTKRNFAHFAEARG